MKTNKVIITVLSVITLLFLTSCTSTPKKTINTDSGHPEILINTTDIDNIKSLLISDNLKHGYVVSKDTFYLLELRRNFTANENANAAQINVLADGLSSLLVGGMGLGYQSLPSDYNSNYYTDQKNYRTVAITFLKSKKSTRVVVMLSKNGVLFKNEVASHLWQGYLNELKDKIEMNIEKF